LLTNQLLTINFFPLLAALQLTQYDVDVPNIVRKVHVATDKKRLKVVYSS